MLFVRNTIESSKKNHDFFAVSVELSGAMSIIDTPLRPSPVPPAIDRRPNPYVASAAVADCSPVMPGRRVQSSAGQTSRPKYSFPFIGRKNRPSDWREPRVFSPLVFSPDFVRVENILIDANQFARRCTV